MRLGNVKAYAHRPKQRRKTRKRTPRQKKEGYRFMDKTEPGKEASEEMTRESLIAISYRLPEKDNAPDFSPKNLNSESLDEDISGDRVEKYRTKLISISSSESPDVKVVPVSPGELKG